MLLVEDADSPTPKPIVHAIAWDLDARERRPARGRAREPRLRGTVEEVGKNPFLKAGWLPPDPPTGHGPHRYLFQVYALNRHLGLGAFRAAAPSCRRCTATSWPRAR